MADEERRGYERLSERGARGEQQQNLVSVPSLTTAKLPTEV